MKLKELFKKTEQRNTCSAVIVAAGSAQRMGADKVMLELGCMPVLARTLLAFQNCDAIDEIIVVTRMEKVEEVASLCKKYGVTKAQDIASSTTTVRIFVLRSIRRSMP